MITSTYAAVIVFIEHSSKYEKNSVMEPLNRTTDKRNLFVTATQFVVLLKLFLI